jgi:general secretion pathway protein A
MIKAFFGFKSYPFGKELPVKDVFPSTVYQEVLSRLDYIKKNRGLMLLTGEPGVGKTVALRSFVENLNPGLYSCCYIPLSTVSPIEFYRQLNLRLTGVFRHRKVDLFHSIQTAIRDMVTNQKKVPVIIIDEAHLLPPQNLYEIQIILNFDIDSTNPAIFILTGQSHLRDKIAQHVNLSLSQRFSIKFHLTPLDKTETAAYIAHRIAVCGCKRSPFSDTALEAIFQNTQGAPRSIDNLALKSLTLAAIENKSSVTEEEVFAASKEL